MGNSISGSVEQHSDLDSICRSIERVRVEDDHMVVTSTTGNHHINYDSRQNMRSQLFGCSAEELGLPIHKSDEATSDAGAHANAKSRSKSQGNIDMAEVISILREIQKSASPNELIELHKALMPSSKDVLLPNSTAEPVPEKNKSSQTHALIRRRSSLTPGIATREQTPRPTQAASPSTLSQAQTWSTDMFCQSPLSKLAGWESKNNGLTERAITPDINYLGIHELGSLRVTNGAVSPDPSIHPGLITKQSLSSIRREDDYFTASEGSGRNSPEKWSSRFADSSSATDSSNNFDVTPKQAPSPHPDVWASVQEFEIYPFDQSTVPESPPSIHTSPNEAHGKFLPGQTSPERANSVLGPYHSEANSNPFLAEAATEQAHVTYSDRDCSISPPRIASAALYQTEADSNPFLPLRDEDYFPRDELPVSSKGMQDTCCTLRGTFPNHDEEDAGEETLSKFNQSQRTGYRTEAYNRLTGYGEPRSTTSSLYTAGSRKEKRENIERPKTDSGYHSESSLRTFNELAAVEEQPGLSESFLSNSRSPGQGGVALRSARDYLAPSESKCLQGKRRPVSIPYGATIAGPSPQIQQRPTLPRLMPLKAPSSGAVHLVTAPGKSLPIDKALPETPCAQIQRESTVVKAPALPRVKSSPLLSSVKDKEQQRQGPRKLQKKKRPFSDRSNSQPVVVQSQTPLQLNIFGLPQIPAEVSSKYSQRMSQHPDMEHLERTFKSVSHSHSRDSVASFEPFNVQNIRFPSPTRYPELETSSNGSRRRRRQSLGTDLHIRDIFRSKSRDVDGTTKYMSNSPPQLEPVPTGFANFGTVVSSIGSSPYDLATSAGDRIQRPKSMQAQRPITHPHQISSNLPRAKSIIGMSDKDASAFAMQRSRDRLECLDATTHDQLSEDQNDVGSEKSQIVPSPPNRSPPPPPVNVSKPMIPRRKSIHGTAVADTQDDGVPQPRSEDTNSSDRRRKSNIAESYPKSSEQTNLDSSEPNWEESAKVWRQHRKSIGENMLREQYDADEQRENVRPRGRPQTPHTRSAPQTPAKARQPGGWETFHDHRRHKQSPHLHDPPMVTETRLDGCADTGLRSSSPTPSVLERAAAFERKTISQPDFTRQSPTRQSRSPLKSSAAVSLAPRNDELGKSRHRSSASTSATPSSVASAYTSSQSNSPSKSHSATSGPPKLFAPRKRPWPTSAHRATDSTVASVH